MVHSVYTLFTRDILKQFCLSVVLVSVVKMVEHLKLRDVESECGF